MNTTTMKTTDYRLAATLAGKGWDMCLAKALDGFAALLPERACVLDVGCGPGRDSQHLRKRGFCAIGADLSCGMLREARWRIGPPLVRCDMRQLPFRAARFDGAWLCASLLHLSRSEAPQALQEIHRVVRPCAPIFVGLIYGEGEQWNTAAGSRCFPYYHPDEIIVLLQECGFSIYSARTQPGNAVTWIEIIARVS